MLIFHVFYLFLLEKIILELVKKGRKNVQMKTKEAKRLFPRPLDDIVHHVVLFLHSAIWKKTDDRNEDEETCRSLSDRVRDPRSLCVQATIHSQMIGRDVSFPFHAFCTLRERQIQTLGL